MPIPNLNNYRNNAVDLINSLEGNLSTVESNLSIAQSNIAALQPKNIRATSSADQAIVAGSFVILDYDTSEYTTGSSDFTLSTDGRITVLNAGVYSITCGTVIEAQVGALDSYVLTLNRNADIVASSGSFADLSAGASLALSVATQSNLSANDVIDARVQITQVVNGVGNGLIRRTVTLFGANAVQVNHLAISKVG